MKRKRKKKGQGRNKHVNRTSGYYWIKLSSGKWIIGRWWQSLQFFDTMGTIVEKGFRDRIVEVDENRIIHEEEIKVKRRRLK